MPIKIGNRVTEKDIRDWLDSNQYLGSTATITDLELHAIRRPGWVQVFRFEVEARIRQECDTDETDSDKKYPIAIIMESSWMTNEFGIVKSEHKSGFLKMN